MSFVINIFFAVLGVTIVVGVWGILIDRAARRHDRT